MRRMHQVVASMVTLALSASIAFAGGGTALTYQGRLLDAGEPANGLFDFEFGLWDAANGGNPIGVPQVLLNTPVADGLFTVQIDFGANAFDNTDRWLEISVDAVPLMPRQPITRAPYSIQTRGIVVNDAQHVGMGVNPGASRLRAWNLAGGAFEAIASGRAVEAISTGGDMAILASNQSPDGMGVFAQHQPSQNQGWLGTPDYGVYGRANDVSNDWAGYFVGRAHVSDTLFVGRETPITPAEVFGIHRDTSVFGGMYVSTSSQQGMPFYGYSAGGGVGDIDAYHYYDGSTGKWHLLVGNVIRLTVRSNGDVGIGTTAPEYTLHVVSAGERAIFGENIATSGLRFGGWFESASTDGAGVFGLATSASGSNVGVAGRTCSSTGSGVSGFAAATSGINYGVRGGTLSNSGYGVFSEGDCHVTGTLSKSGGAFKIDHPLDPGNKYLQHSFVESPDMMNVYNGNVILDENGEAYVGLPDYFDGLNRDFRYQLTPMGAAMPNLHISQEIANNSFGIAGGKAGMKVSWQVTGIRQDPWAEAHRIEVEPYKRPEHQGKYLNPELYDQPKEMAVHYFPDAERPATDAMLAEAQSGRASKPVGQALSVPLEFGGPESGQGLTYNLASHPKGD